MKYIILMLVLISNVVQADKVESSKLLSFYQIIGSSELFENQVISIRGFLLEDDDGLYFCMDMESCFSRGKERVKVIIKPIEGNDDIKDYLKLVNRCHMELSGEYKGLDFEQSGWPLLGYLYVSEKPSFDFNSNYKQINSSCKAFNVITKKVGDG